LRLGHGASLGASSEERHNCGEPVPLGGRLRSARSSHRPDELVGPSPSPEPTHRWLSLARAGAVCPPRVIPEHWPIRSCSALGRLLSQTSRVAEPHLFRVILPVSDIEAAASFYAHALGIPGDRVSAGRHYFPCGGTILACFDALADGDSEAVRPNPEHIYFSVNGLDAVRERVRDCGAADVTPIETQPWGERSFYARDPFGNPICFVDSETLFTGSSSWPTS
jgi:predicted enzyme related to lactoylglutathione lyase